MAILETLTGRQSAAFRIAESAERLSQLSKTGEMASDLAAGIPSPAISAHFSAVAKLQNVMRSAFQPRIAVTAQLKLHQSKVLAAIAPTKETVERLSALSEALKINASFHHLGEAGAFTQIRRFEELTGDRILRFDEDHFFNKIALCKSLVPTYADINIDAGFNFVSPASLAGFIPVRPVSLNDFTPVQTVTVDDFVRIEPTYFDDYLSCRESLKISDNFLESQQLSFHHTTDRLTELIIEPDFWPRPDYLAIVADKSQTIEERGRAFAFSGLPFHYWSNYFCDEDFNTWVEDEVETAKRHRERILCLVNKINQIYRRASRIILQAYRRLNRSWKNSFVFSWRHAYLNQIHALKDAEIKLSDFFISKPPRYSREPSFFSYEFSRKHDFPPPGNSL